MSEVQAPGGEPTARTRVARPPRAPEGIVARPRLYDFLDVATKAPLTMLVAPAGAGKTVLLSGWLAARDAGGATDVWWLAAHDHARFDAMVGEFAAGAVPGALVVVDDAHLLSRASLRRLSDVITQRPEAVCVVLAARRDLPLPSVALELRGLSATLRMADLTFTEDEAAALVRQHAADATAADVRVLHESTNGWAAALVLGARTLGRGDAEGGPAWPTRADRPVLDFLLGEAWGSLRRPIRHLLLSTYHEPTITAARAALLSGHADAGTLLSSLVDDGLLVTAYEAGDGSDEVFRYHPLLVELLRRRVAKGGADAMVAREARGRAAMSDSARGNGVGAVEHALASRDDALVASLLVRHGCSLLVEGQADVVGAALDQLPPDVMAGHPAVVGVAGLHRIEVGDPNGAVVLAAQARAAVRALDRAESSDEDADALRCDTVRLRLWQARMSPEDRPSARTAAYALVGTPRATGGARRSRLVIGPDRRAALLFDLAVVEAWSGELEFARLHVEESLLAGEAARQPLLVAHPLALRSLLELGAGAVQNADRTAAEARAVAARASDPAAPPLELALIVSAWSAHFRLADDVAAAHLAHPAVADVARRDPLAGLLAALLEASMALTSGAVAKAQQLMATLRPARASVPAFLAREIALLDWRCSVLAGDEGGAAAAAAALTAHGNAAGARLLALAGDPSGAPEVAAELDTLVESLTAESPLLATVAAVIRAERSASGADRRAAAMALRDVLTRIAPQETVLLLAHGVQGTPELLAVLVDEAGRPEPHPYAGAALAALSGRAGEGGGRGAASVAAAGQPRQAVLNGVTVTITRREADVLGQLALGGSYTEIGEALFISENTVKTHLASLYRKLGVEKRSAALRVARDIGLL